MRTLGTNPSWTYRIGFNAAIDFCIWILEVDGLRISPFNLHPDGNKSLRASGLNADNWRSWFAKVASSQDQKQSPPTLWNGGSETRAALEKLWEAYQLLSDQRGSWDEKIGRKLEKELPNLWNDLKPYHTSLNSLTIDLVNYSKEVVEVVSPTSVIFSIVHGDIKSETFHSSILEVARKLASQSPARRSKSINAARHRVPQNEENMNVPKLSVQNQEEVLKELRILQPGETKKSKISRFVDHFVILDIDGMEIAIVPESIAHQPDKDLEVSQEVEIRVLQSNSDQFSVGFKLIS
jgi:hypothetical protein